MARIDASLSITGDEAVSFHESNGRMVMLLGPDSIGMVFPDAATARTWFAVTHGRIMEWEHNVQRTGLLPDDQIG